MRHTLSQGRRSGVSDPSQDWTRHETYQVNGRTLEYGTEFSVRGEPGRFRFLYAVWTQAGRVWIDCMGGPVKFPMWRSFRLDQIKTVHRISKTRENQETT